MLVVIAAMLLGGCERSERPAPAAEQQSAQVSLFNATNDVLLLERRSIHSDYAVDCELIAEQPDRYVTSDHLSSARSIGEGLGRVALSGLELPVTSDRESTQFTDPCRFAFIDSETSDQRLPPIAVVWPRSLPEKIFYPDVDAPADVPPEEQTVVARADYSGAADEDVRPWRQRPCGGDFDACTDDERIDLIQPVGGAGYHWEIHGDDPRMADWSPGTLADLPTETPDGENCNTEKDATPLDWDSPPDGTWRVDSVSEMTVEFGANSEEETGAENQAPGEYVEWTCWDVDLIDQNAVRTWSFCGSRRLAETIESEHIRGDVYVEFFAEEQFSTPPAAYEAVTIELERTDDDGETFEEERIELVRGHGLPDHIGLTWRTMAADGCEPVREVEECDQVILPAHLQIDASGEVVDIRPGETMGLDAQADRRLEYVRGMHRAVSDLRCGDERVGPGEFSYPGAYMEFVYYPGVSVVEL